MLGRVLLAGHNLLRQARLMEAVRRHAEAGSLPAFRDWFLGRYPAWGGRAVGGAFPTVAQLAVKSSSVAAATASDGGREGPGGRALRGGAS